MIEAGRTSFILTSWSPGVRELDSETVLIKLRRVHRHQTGETLARGIDHIQITVRTVVPAQANVSAGALIIRGVHLQQRRERQEAGKGVIRLKTAEDDREVAGLWRQRIPSGIARCSEAEAVPLFGKIERQTLAGPVRRPYASFIQMPVVVAAETLVEIESQPPVLR